MVMQDPDAQGAQPDELDLEQQALDGSEGGTPQYVTAEQFRALESRNQQLEAYLQRLQNHASGLESRIDKGFNAIKNDLTGLTQRQIEAQMQQLEASILEGIEDPQEKQRYQALLNLQKMRQQPQQTEPPEPQAPPQQAAEPPAQSGDAWAQVQAFVRNAGVDPSNPAIDYQVLVDTTKTQAERQAAFMQSLIKAAQPQSPQQAQRPAPQNNNQPSPSRAPGPAGTGFRNIDDVYDAFISGTIDQQKYREAAAKFGVTV